MVTEAAAADAVDDPAGALRRADDATALLRGAIALLMAGSELLGDGAKLLTAEAAELATDGKAALLTTLEAEFSAGAALESAAMNTAQTMAFANWMLGIVRVVRDAAGGSSS